MKWKKNAVNKYPDILLSDCVVDGMHLDNQNIVLNFFKSGIVIKESSSIKYYRTKDAQIVLEKCDINNVSIYFVCKKKGLFSVQTNIVKSMELDIFLENISISKWRFEVVEEFYSDLGVIFIGKVRSHKESFWCYIKIYFKDIKYFWNEVDYEKSIN